MRVNWNLRLLFIFFKFKVVDELQEKLLFVVLVRYRQLIYNLEKRKGVDFRVRGGGVQAFYINQASFFGVFVDFRM